VHLQSLEEEHMFFACPPACCACDTQDPTQGAIR
jgi:hypothetical protein